MKIYYIANARIPSEKAHAIQIAKMSEAFLRAGADLKLLVPWRKTSEKTSREFYGLKLDIPLKRLPAIDLFNFGWLGFFIGSLSFMVSYFGYLFWKKISGEEMVIYTIDMDNFSFLAVPFLKRPYFAELHDAKKKNIFWNFFFKRIKGLIVINQLIKEEIKKNFSLADEKILVFPNGIDLEFFEGFERLAARNRLNLPINKKIVLYLGKFYQWKGLEILIELASRLDENTLLYFVGGDKKELERITNQSFSRNNIICVGQRDYKEIPEWLAAADVLLVLGTKKNEYSYLHTSPMKLFEYLASRRPVVASATPAIKQIVSEKEVWFYEPDDAESLFRAVGEALIKETSEKIENGFEKVKNFSWQKRAEDVLNLIRSQIL